MSLMPKKTGYNPVSPDEMRAHNRVQDAWIAIRGNVYNVTDYLDQHPGGLEIMRGVGASDATPLFDQVHPWVNYDRILSGHYVGRQTRAEDFTNPWCRKTQRISPSPSTVMLAKEREAGFRLARELIAVNNNRVVRYEYVQKSDVIMVYFFIGVYTNPFFEIRRPFNAMWTFVCTYPESVFTFRVKPYSTVIWPPLFKVFQELGKIEVGFQKSNAKAWSTIGNVNSYRRQVLGQQCKRKYVIKKHVPLNKFTFLIAIQKADSSLCNAPLGFDMLMYNEINEGREYTPIPYFFIAKSNELEGFTSPLLTLLIRRYPDGRLSNFLFNKKVGDVVLGTDPGGAFDLQIISNKEHYLFISGGVGVASCLPLVLFLLEKKVKPILSIILIMFNQTSEYQIFDSKLAVLASDKRFRFFNVFTRTQSDYVGISGHITEHLVITVLKRTNPDIRPADYFVFVAGPIGLHAACNEIFQSLGVHPYDMFSFASNLKLRESSNGSMEFE